MKTRTLGYLFVAALALLAWAAPAKAGDCELGFSGGIGIPTGDFKDENLLDGRTGPQFGVDFSYMVTPSIAIGVDGSWNRNKHGAEGSVEDLGGGVTLTANKDKFNTIQYGVHGKYMFPTAGKIDPYFMLGLGFYNMKEDYEYTQDDGVTKTVFTDESDNIDQPGSRFGYKVGLGATYMTSPKLGLGVGVDYNSISMDKDKFGVSTVPYLSVRGRISFHFAKS